MLMMSDILTQETLDAIETTIDEDALVYLAYVVGMHRGASVQEWMSVSIERLRAHRVFEDAAVREDNAILQRIDARLNELRNAADAVERIKSIDHSGYPLLIKNIEGFKKIFGQHHSLGSDVRSYFNDARPPFIVRVREGDEDEVEVNRATFDALRGHR